MTVAPPHVTPAPDVGTPTGVAGVLAVVVLGVNAHLVVTVLVSGSS